MMLLAALILLQSPAAPPRDAAPASATSHAVACCTLRGRVIDAQTERPIRSASVTVMIQRTHESRSTSTDQDGRWEISELPEGDYYPHVQKAGYAQSMRIRPGANTLSASNSQRTLDIRLTRGAVLRGRVVDKNGEPLEDLRVMAVRATPTPNGVMFQGTSSGEKTNDLGEFRLYGLPEGEFVLVAARMGGPVTAQRSIVEVPTYYPNTTSAEEAQRFTLAAGAEYSDLLIELQSLPGVKVSGRVASSNGPPGQAFISLRPERDSQAMPFMGTHISVAPDGQFGGGPVPAGRYKLSVQGQNLNGEREAANVDLVVGESDLTNILVEMRPPTAISGRVVTDPPGRPLPHPIQLGPGRLNRRSREIYGVGEGGTAKPDGTFEVKSYESPVTVIQQGPLNGWFFKSVRWKGEDVTGTGVTFTPGEPVTGVEVVLGRLSSRLRGAVSGTRKTTVAGEEHEGTVVLLRQRDGETEYHFARATAIRDGGYEFSNLMAGDYLAIALANTLESAMSPDGFGVLVPMATDVSLEDDETKVVNLKIITP